MTRRRLLGAFAVGLLAVALTACTAAASPDVDHADLDLVPHAVGAPAPDVTGSELLLPESFGGTRIFDPGWAVPPLESHGVYLAPVVQGDRVTFTAVSAEGTVLWTAERPMLCSSFVVTADEDGPLAILMDISAGNGTVSETTVSAYNLRTGAKRWGPVDVPGPHVGPGLVFAAPPPESMGDNGARLAIDPATGSTLADESTQTGLLILGGYHGVVLLTDDARLVARTAEEPELWSLPLAYLDQLTADLRTAFRVTDGGLALLGDRTTGATLVDLTEGTVIAHQVHDIALDLSTGIRIVHGDDLRAVDAAGQALWTRVAPADATLVSAGGGSVYLRSAGRIDVFDTASGEATSSLPGDALVPKKISEAGAGIIGSYERPLLVASPR